MIHKTFTNFSISAAVFFGAFLLSPGLGYGFEEVRSSPHDIFPKGPAGRDLSACDACHIESEDSENPPLWDGRNAIRSYPVEYMPGKGQKFKSSIETKPIGPSFKCMTCHDGVLGNDVHGLGFADGGPDPLTQNISLNPASRTPDHPDSVAYPLNPEGRLVADSPDPRLQRYWAIPDKSEDGVTVPTGPTSSYLGLQGVASDDPVEASRLVRTFQGMIHCDSCHNPHDDMHRPFLRVPHKDLCLVCHDR
ncbi:MAG TPA: cytochrome c3 family protein [Nitrospiria bacterium]|nr:cytochrome c3 family protein [Nitrospiria bacterium]